LDGVSLKPLAVASQRFRKQIRGLVKAGQLSKAGEELQKILPKSAGLRKLRMKVQYSRANLDAARQEAVLYAQQVAPALRGLDLNELLDKGLGQEPANNESEIAERLWPYLNLPKSAKPDWLARLRWGLKVNDVIGDWILANANRLDPLEDILDDPDWSLLYAAQTEGRPAILAGAHLGPKSLAIHAANRLDISILMLHSNLTYSLAIGSQPFVTTNDRHAIIALRDKLAKCGTVYIASDGKGGSSGLSNRIFGTTVTLRGGVAALARATHAQTFWYAARWAGRRIVLDLVAGPTPQDGETREDWNARWSSFYLAQFEKSVSHGPENLRPKTLRRLLVTQ
jgi:hypothetical protein